MKELKCPSCGTAFSIDEAGYAALLAQVRGSEFEREVAAARAQAEKEFRGTLEAAKAQAQALVDKQSAAYREELVRLKSELARKDSEAEASARELAAGKDRKILELEGKLSAFSKEAEAESLRRLSEEREKRAALERRISELESGKKAEVLEAVSREREAAAVKEREALSRQEKARLEMEALKSSYEERLRLKDEQVAYYRDFKAKQSTKMVGESLERHCEEEFEKLRAVGFQNASFGKDNDASTGSKGDYIYREYAPDGTEVVSIMFEMKNQNEETATKHKNADFLKELDKDRREKHCEYAVLVSLLETDSDLYNAGIVDVSHVYPKMYVVRPQCFIPIITVLRNAAFASLEARQELARIRETDVDVSRFEEKLLDFKDKFSKNYETASKKFQAAIEEIDKSILHMQKVKDALVSSENQLRLAGNKADNLTVDRLVRGNPTMKAMFQALDVKNS